MSYDDFTAKLVREIAELRTECAALRAAVKALYMGDSGNALFPYACRLCNWQAWKAGEPEQHAPGCLAVEGERG